MQQMTELLNIESIVAPQDVGTADVTGSWADMRRAGRFAVLAQAGACTDGSEFTVQLRQATSAAGANAKDLGDPVTVAGVGGAAPEQVVIEHVQGGLDLNGGLFYVTAVLGVDEDAILGSAWVIRDDNRRSF